MSLESDITLWLEKSGRQWSIKDKGFITPEQEDVQAALDEAARVLYDEPIGTRLNVGGLIIEKKARGHDVYVFAGTYE